MKHSRLMQTLCLLFALCVIMTSVPGCGSQSSSQEPVSSSQAVSSEPEQEPEPEEDLEIQRVFLVEKIDEGIARNPDTVGWLYIPNTEIDNAVLQGPDNDYYLRIDEDKKYDIFGCYFADFRCELTDRDSLVKNTIIYGHSDYRDDPEGKRFSQLFHYAQDIDFVRNNPYIYFSVPEDDLVWQVFAVFFTHIDFNYIQTHPSEEEFQYILDEARARSEYIIDVPVTTEDRILTLSTCSGEYVPGDHTNYRLVVMAKLLPTNEVTQLTMEVEPNPNPKKS
ncbi:MAG: hypothetical protein DBX44_03415 [Oscillospiraceae bacterium]|nr:MAG: hypothetical protein DBX44_03415 [Oscillospiraceae bacterium]